MFGTRTSCAPVSESGGKDPAFQSKEQSTPETGSIAEGWNQPSSSKLQENKSQKYSNSKSSKVGRKFREEWFYSFPWMQFDKDNEKVFCGICCKFPTIADKKTKFVEGCTPIKKETLVKHQESRCHTLCAQQLEAKENETPVVFGWCSPTEEDSDAQHCNITPSQGIDRIEIMTTHDSVKEGTV